MVGLVVLDEVLDLLDLLLVREHVVQKSLLILSLYDGIVELDLLLGAQDGVEPGGVVVAVDVHDVLVEWEDDVLPLLVLPVHVFDAREDHITCVKVLVVEEFWLLLPDAADEEDEDLSGAVPEVAVDRLLVPARLVCLGVGGVRDEPDVALDDLLHGGLLLLGDAAPVLPHIHHS